MGSARFDKILTKKYLIINYVKNKKRTPEIAQEISCSDRTVALYLKKYKIKIRDIKKENHPNWIDGKWHVKYKCIELGCNNLICSINHFKGKGRCKSCAFKGRRNNGFIDGRTLKKYYCKCGKEIHSHTALYTTEKCSSCSRLGNKHWNWQGGKSFEPYPLGWTKTFKEQIRYRDRYKCQLCGVPEIECNRKLSIHHKDYNKNNILPKNLISLCQSCHMKTNYNRKYWVEYFKGDKNVTCIS